MTLEEYKQSIIKYMDFGIKHTDLQDEYSTGFRNGIRWCKSLIDGVEPIYDTADTPQTDKDKVVCPNCGRSDYIRSFEKDFGIKSDFKYKCINCNTYIKDAPQTDCETCRHYKLACELFSEVCKYEPITQTETQNSNLTFEIADIPQTEPINLQGGEDVHNFCKRCKESRVRHFYGEPYIVCKQADDAPSICLKKCPLRKWIAEDVYLITLQMERSANEN